MFKKYFASVLIFVVAGSLIAGTQPRFFNVDLTVQEDDAPTQVKLRIPMGLIGVMTPQIQDALDNVDHEETGFDIRKIWSEIRGAGSTRFVEVHKTDVDLVVETQGDQVLISVDSEEKGRINIQVNMALGDALFNGTTDVASMIETLNTLLNQDLVSISGDNINGRVWID